MKGSWGITTDVNICLINNEIIKNTCDKKTLCIQTQFESKSLSLNEYITPALFITF